MKKGVRFWAEPVTTAQAFETIRFCKANIAIYESEIRFAYKDKHLSPDANDAYIKTCNEEMSVHLDELFAANRRFMQLQVNRLNEI